MGFTSNIGHNPNPYDYLPTNSELFETVSQRNKITALTTKILGTKRTDISGTITPSSANSTFVISYPLHWDTDMGIIPAEIRINNMAVAFTKYVIDDGVGLTNIRGASTPYVVYVANFPTTVGAAFTYSVY